MKTNKPQQPKEVKHIEGELEIFRIDDRDGEFLVGNTKPIFDDSTGYAKMIGETTHGLAIVHSEANAKELVKRWNLFPELTELLTELHAFIKKEFPNEDGEAIIETERLLRGLNIIKEE